MKKLLLVTISAAALIGCGEDDRKPVTRHRIKVFSGGQLAQEWTTTNGWTAGGTYETRAVFTDEKTGKQVDVFGPCVVIEE